MPVGRIVVAVGEAQAAEVTKFFRTHSFAALLLPDGWFGGRPMENQHRLTFVASRPKRLLIELDDQVLLSIIGKRVSVRHITRDLGQSLVLDGFRACVIEYLDYGDDRPQPVMTFSDGAIEFVAHDSQGNTPR